MNARLNAGEAVGLCLRDLPLRVPARVIGFMPGTEAADPELCLRLAEIGFLDGERVQVIAQAAFGGPLAVRVGTATFALRRVEAAAIRVVADRP